MKMNLFFVVVVPPPVTGMTMANKKMLSIFKEIGCSVVDRSISRTAKKNYVWIFQKNIQLFFKLLRISFEKKKTDGIYFVPDSSLGLWINLILHLPLMLVMRGPVIMHHHVFRYCKKKSLPMSLITYLLGSRLLNICLSDSMCGSFLLKYPNSDCISLGNYILVDDSKQKSQKDSLETVVKNEISVGYLSNITKEKGILEFIEVVNRLNEQQHNCFYKGLIAGPMCKDLEKIILETIRPNSTNFEIVGPVYGERKVKFINRCHLFLFPTRYPNEAYPLTILEFMLSDIPVISTNIGCIPEIINMSENIFSVDSFVDLSVVRILNIFSGKKNYQEEIKKTQKRVDELKKHAKFQIEDLGRKTNYLFEARK
jgi:glycosyltransferase involved in cell wall biosynthesis